MSVIVAGDGLKFVRHLLLLAGVIAVHTAAAQDTTKLNATVVAGQGKGAADNGGASDIQVTPKQIVIDPSSKVATIKLTNAGNDTAEATIAVQAVKAGGKGSAQSSAGASAVVGSLASWVQGLPSEVTLAPHETRSITAHVNVPDHLTEGEYAADVVVSPSGGTPAIDDAMVQQALRSIFKVPSGNGAQKNGKKSQQAPAQDAAPSNASTCRLTYHASH